MKQWFERVLALTLKELKEYIRSHLLIFLSAASPLVMFLLFSYGFTLDVKDIPFSFVDENKTPISRDLIDRMTHNDYFDLVAERNDVEEIMDDMLHDRVRFAVIIPGDFSRNLSAARSTPIQILVNGTMASRANITRGYLEGFMGSYNQKILVEYLQKTYGADSTNNPLNILPVARFDPTLESKNTLVPGLAGLVLLIFPAVLASISLSRERESGMILNFYISPLSRLQFLLGKLAPLLVIGMLNYLLFFILTIQLFQVPFTGNFGALLLGGFLLILSSCGIGFLIASMIRSQVASLLITTIITFLPGFLYSGLMMPIEGMGAEGKMTATILPIYYYIRLAKTLFLKSGSVFAVIPDLIPMVVISLVLFVSTLLLLKKKI